MKLKLYRTIDKNNVAMLARYMHECYNLNSGVHIITCEDIRSSMICYASGSGDFPMLPVSYTFEVCDVMSDRPRLIAFVSISVVTLEQWESL
jgi:hypothetical protein